MKRIGQEGKVLKQACLRAWLPGWLSTRLVDLGHSLGDDGVEGDFR